MVGTDVILSLASWLQYHLPLFWDSALGKGWEEGGGCFRFKSLWLYMIFGVKHFWVHSIYYFMLLVQGVRLDWLVFHMISFLLMDTVSKLMCFDWLKKICLNRIIITVYEYVSYRICMTICQSMVGSDMILSLARGVQYNLQLFWNSALGKGWEDIQIIMALYDFWSKTLLCSLYLLLYAVS